MCRDINLLIGLHGKVGLHLIEYFYLLIRFFCASLYLIAIIKHLVSLLETKKLNNLLKKFSQVVSF